MVVPARPMPPGEDGIMKPRAAARSLQQQDPFEAHDAEQMEGVNTGEAYNEDDPWQKPSDETFLQLVKQAEDNAQVYANQVNRKSWQRSYRAYLQEHFTGSKYTSREYANRSKLFIPKTRAAVRKDLAAISASLFGTIDAISIQSGNESDPLQQAGAAVMQELVNYRTDRASGKASIPWFHVALGSRQTALLTGICLSKQYWKLEMRKQGEEDAVDDLGEPELDADGAQMKRDVWVPHIDRPDCALVPPENFVIDSAADWTNPAQDAAFVIIKWPMRIDEIRRKQKDPRQPWRDLEEDVLRSGTAKANMDQAAIRRAREQNLDRFDETQTGQEFEIIWVYETYMRCAGEDWTFLSVGDKALLTDVRPVREVYPEQFGERPLAFGYGAFEAFRMFPMSSVESWQPLQQEANDIRNLSLDAIKQNVMPVTKVVRGKQIDLDAIKRRGPGNSIMLSHKDDVTWEKAPDVSAGVFQAKQMLDIEFDDLAGQQNYGTVADNNALGKTLGGLKLAAGAANAVQEFDQRVWIETWAEPALTQIVRLIQYYESDPVILGLCGERAKLFAKFGVNEINDELMEQSVLTRINVGLGAGDPQQRLQKFAMAASIAIPILEKTRAFATGQKELDDEAVMSEIFGATGYRDGGKRFVKKAEQQPNPMQDAEVDKTKSEAERNRAQAKATIFNAIVGAAKIGLEEQRQQHDQTMDKAGFAREGQQAEHDNALSREQHQLSKDQHAHQVDEDHVMRNFALVDKVMAGLKMGNDYGNAEADRNQRGEQFKEKQITDRARAAAKPSAKEGGGEGGSAPSSSGAEPPTPPKPEADASAPQPQPAPMPAPAGNVRRIRNIQRGPDGRIVALDVA
jgi:hypothetical protein